MSPHRIVIVVADGIQSLDAVGPHEVFHTATSAHVEVDYEVLVAAPSPGTVRAESGVRLGVDVTLDRVRELDTLVVAGGLGIRKSVDDESFVNHVRRLASHADRVASVCTGAALLAAAGVLDGRRATTHWAFAEEIAARWPAVRIEPDQIYVQDGHVWTSAGVTAGMDLALALVADDHGAEVAHSVAQWLVMYARRGGGQSQFSPQLRAATPDHDGIRALLAWLPDHLDRPLTVEVLAEQAIMTPRTFARTFRRQIGETPAAHVERLRIDAAQRLLETTDLGLAAIASRVGFGRPETLHRAFRRRLGTTPDSYRHNFSFQPT